MQRGTQRDATPFALTHTGLSHSVFLVRPQASFRHAGRERDTAQPARRRVAVLYWKLWTAERISLFDEGLFSRLFDGGVRVVHSVSTAGSFGSLEELLVAVWSIV